MCVCFYANVYTHVCEPKCVYLNDANIRRKYPYLTWGKHHCWKQTAYTLRTVCESVQMCVYTYKHTCVCVCVLSYMQSNLIRWWPSSEDYCIHTYMCITTSFLLKFTANHSNSFSLLNHHLLFCISPLHSLLFLYTYKISSSGQTKDFIKLPTPPL